MLAAFAEKTSGESSFPVSEIVLASSDAFHYKSRAHGEAPIGMPKPRVKKFPIEDVAEILRTETARWKDPIVTRYSRERRSPFRVLIATILSLRTKDVTTEAASERLFALADTPQKMLGLDEAAIAAAIYPVGFYNVKAATIRKVCQQLLERFGGRVPDSVEELLMFPGVGRKTANLVVGLGYGKPAICVDTHVHRITNRWGYVKTKTPEQTEMALRRILPERYWVSINDWLVTYGQNLCLPISPKCSNCRILPHCAREGVERSR